MLRSLELENVRSGAWTAPELVRNHWKCAPAIALSQKDIEQLTYYAVNAVHHAQKSAADLRLPLPRQNPESWPNWKEWSGGLVERGFRIWSPNLVSPLTYDRTF